MKPISTTANPSQTTPSVLPTPPRTRERGFVPKSALENMHDSYPSGNLRIVEGKIILIDSGYFAAITPAPVSVNSSAETKFDYGRNRV